MANLGVLAVLEEALKASWNKDTAYGNGERWTPDCPEVDQCAVTAMVVQDYLGGELLRCVCDDGDSHYWNMLETGVQVDLTYDQFEFLGVTPYKNDFVVRERSYVDGNKDTVKRYKILKKRVQEYLRGLE